jgi:hypothetical protein
VRLRSHSETFDDGRGPLAKRKRVRFAKPGKRTVRLRLTGPAKQALRGCEARSLVVVAKRRRAAKDMVRTGSCGPQPVDLSRAEDCDFIGQQGGSLCMVALHAAVPERLLHGRRSLDADRQAGRLPRSGDARQRGG